MSYAKHKERSLKVLLIFQREKFRGAAWDGLGLEVWRV